MNKKVILGMLAAAGMLLATSCTQDELDAAQSGNETQVTFSLGLEGGHATRAISDGTTANKLVYAVFNEKGEPLSVFDVDKDGVYEQQKIDEIGNITAAPHKVTISLAKGQYYKVAFWAQNKECQAYNTADLRRVTIDYAGVNNDETRDAFFKTIEFKVEGNKTYDVVLTRPFAQVNVGVTAEDWEAAVLSGIQIEKSAVVIKNAASSINLLTGEVGEESTDVEVTYTSGVIPSDPKMLKVETNENNPGKEEYHWLSMSYILVADHEDTPDENGILGNDKTTLESLAYTFSPVNGNDITFAEGLNSVPVQRNYRTNILGKILSGDIQFNITVDPVYEGDINNEKDWGAGYTVNYPETRNVYTADELAEAVAAGYTNIRLEDGEYDVHGCGGKNLTISGSKKAIIKLYNDGEDGCDYAFGGNGTGVGTYVFNGVTIDTQSNTGNYKGFAYMGATFNDCAFVGPYSLNNANDFVFNRCTFDFKNGYFWTWGANSVKFDGCTFNGNSKAILAHGYASTAITINDCTFAATEQGFTSNGDNTATVEIDPAGTNTYTITFTGNNTKTDSYSGWTRIKDGSTGHHITEPN